MLGGVGVGWCIRWLEPVATTYRGHTIHCCPPPNHGVQIIECLNLLEEFPLAEWGHNSERSLHHFFECMKRSAADRAVRIPAPAILLNCVHVQR